MDLTERLFRCGPIYRRHGGHRLTGKDRAIDRDNRMIFVFAASHVWADVREIFTRKDGDNAGHRLGLAGIDRADACMRIGAAQKFAFGHFRYHEIAGVLCLASDLINAVDAVNRVANNRKFPLLLDHVLRPLRINTRVSKSPAPS